MINSVMTTRIEPGMSRNFLFVANRIKERYKKIIRTKWQEEQETRLSRKCVPLQLYYTSSVVEFYQTNLHLIHKDQKVFQSAHI